MYYADLHIHSPYSKACSQRITFDGIEEMAIRKGIKLMGTGDCFHPAWMDEIDMLTEDQVSGLYFNQNYDVLFIPTVEVSCEAKGKKIHVLLVIDCRETVRKVRSALDDFGSFERNGRPVLRLTVNDLMDEVKSFDGVLTIPAHVMTPWYGIMGEKNRIDDIEEYLDCEPDALETGLSADKTMVESTLDKWVVPLVSFSDAHSMPKIGREVSIFPGDPSFSGIKASLTEGTVDTIEYPPALGKYHYSGHRKCKFSIGVQDDLICDKCMRRVTVGVEQRVADIQKTPIERDKLTGERYMIPLADLIASMHKLQAHDDFVLKEYDRITRQVPEIELLTTNDLKSLVDDKQLKDLILEVRNRQIKIIPGYDGQFGKIVDIYPILNKWMEKAYLLFMEKHDHKKAWEMAEAISAMMNSGEMAMSREEYEAINKGNKRPLR